MLFFSSEIAGSCNALVNYASTSIRLRFDDATAIRPRRTTVRRPTIKTDMLFFPAYKLIVVKSIRAKPEEGFLLVQLLLNSCYVNIKGGTTSSRSHRITNSQNHAFDKMTNKNVSCCKQIVRQHSCHKSFFLPGRGHGRSISSSLITLQNLVDLRHTVLAYVGSRNILERWGPSSWDENELTATRPSSHVYKHAEFGRSTSNDMYMSKVR